jgi:hypothetical protein
LNPKESVTELINQNYNKYLAISKSIAYEFGSSEHQDILHECILYVYEMSDDKILVMLPYFERYLMQMIKFSCQGKLSKYQQKYNKQQNDKNIIMESIQVDILDDIEEPTEESIKTDSLKTFMEYYIDQLKKNPVKDLEKILNILKINWYDKNVYCQYIKTNKSFKTLSKELLIPDTSLFTTYTKVKKTLESLFIFNKNTI